MAAEGRESGEEPFRVSVFGEREGTEAAQPGSYGLAPDGFRLPGGTRLGPVTLQVADLGRSLDWYERVLGLRRLPREGNGDTARLGAADDLPLVELRERPGIAPVPRRGRLGLFHFAILLPDRPALGRFVRHLAAIDVRAGAGDHLVSEAFYLQDPDNLGIEVYADRPRASWRRIGRELLMTTDPVDVQDLLAAADATPWQGMPPGTALGHVHLHVGDLDRAAAFYSGVLGFDRTVWNYPGALFFGADGYHHHVGTNLWAGPAAQPPAADEAQLLGWEIVLSDPASLAAARASAAGAGYTPTPEAAAADGGFGLADPWGLPVRLRAAR